MRRLMINGILIATAVFVSSACSMLASQKLSPALSVGSKYPVFWPPKKGSKFPDLCFKDASGKGVNLSRYQGKVILVEEIGMNCPACNAFSGAGKSGGFQGVSPQSGLPAIDEYIAQQGIDTNNPRLQIVDILLYDMNLQCPTPKDASEWANHFHINQNNRIVLVGDKSLLGSASYDLIPGFQLIDPSFTLVSDSTGHNPQDDLWRHLVPKLKELLR